MQNYKRDTFEPEADFEGRGRARRDSRGTKVSQFAMAKLRPLSFVSGPVITEKVCNRLLCECHDKAAVLAQRWSKRLTIKKL